MAGKSKINSLHLFRILSCFFLLAGVPVSMAHHFLFFPIGFAIQKAQTQGTEPTLVRVNIVTRFRGAKDTVEINGKLLADYSPKLYLLKTRYLIEQKRLAFNELYVFIDISDPHDEIIYKYWEPGSERALASCLRTMNKFFQRHSFLCFYTAAILHLNRERIISNAFPKESADARFWMQDLREYLRRAEPEKDRFLWPNKQSAREEWGREGLSLCERYMTELQTLCAQHGIRMTIVVYPSPYQLTGVNLEGIPVTFWRAFAQEHRVGFLNLFPLFIGSEPPQAVYANYFIKGDIHWNEAGNRQVAKAVLDHIRESSR